MRHRSNNYWWVILLLIFVGTGGLLSVLLPFIVIGIVIYAMAQAGGRRSDSSSSAYRRTSRRSTPNRAARRFSPSELAVINVWLRRFFGNHRLLQLTGGTDLRMHGSRYSSLSSLDVYKDGMRVCTLDEFGDRFPDDYDRILDGLQKMATGSFSPDETVVDVEATEHREPEPEEKKAPEPEKKEKDSAYFIEEIDRLNTNITDETISNGLFETCALLKQIQALEKKFPDSRGKLDKLYEYYLPILVRILTQFDNLQSAASDPNYAPTRQKLDKTIDLINDAMKTIISSMTDQDFINLSADISTLEAVLQKDGYAGDIRMPEPNHKSEKE